VQHLGESGCKSYDQCVDRFGIGDAGFSQGVAGVGLDTSRCEPD
jgi:hypothetical protein